MYVKGFWKPQRYDSRSGTAATSLPTRSLTQKSDISSFSFFFLSGVQKQLLWQRLARHRTAHVEMPLLFSGSLKLGKPGRWTLLLNINEGHLHITEFSQVCLFKLQTKHVKAHPLLYSGLKSYLLFLMMSPEKPHYIHYGCTRKRTVSILRFIIPKTWH